MGIARGTPYSVDDLVAAVRQRRGMSADTGRPRESLRPDEYEALSRGRSEVSKDQEFVCVPAGDIPTLVREWFDLDMQVTRLREVRVLCSFARVLPSTGGVNPDSPVLYDHNPGWLPGIEVAGEGVFLRLDSARLRIWETRQDVQEHILRLDENYRARCARYGRQPERSITPRLVLIHTLAHALIGQWSLGSGYPASALRERLYVSDEMAGLLIYTATSDSAGSLGGVIAEAEPRRFEEGLLAAIHQTAWCSGDPLCLEADTSGVDSLNIAACHACILLPEVSCEEMNLFLDRTTLVGKPGQREIGFFGSLLERGLA